MMWFTEDPFPPMAIAVLLAITTLYIWMRNGKLASLLIGLCCIGSTVGIYFVEQAIVTEREEIESLTVELSERVTAGDVESTVGYISKQSPEIRAMIAGAMGMVTVEDVEITDTSVKITAEGSRAIIRFRANGTVFVKSLSSSQHSPTRWEVTWQRESDQWKIIKVDRLNVINGDRIGILAGK